MKKYFSGAVLALTLFMSHGVFAADAPVANEAQAQSSVGVCPEEHPCPDQRCNECWCLYTRYKPCYYTTKRCVEEQVPCKKRCCRYVNRYYEVERCRYVPEKYTETVCRQEPEWYEVDDCKTCKRWVCDQHCKYVPEYYWKHTCGESSCNVPCPK